MTINISLPGGGIIEYAGEKASIEEIMKHLKINPIEVIVAKNGKIISEEETAKAGDELKIVRIVHGG